MEKLDLYYIDLKYIRNLSAIHKNDTQEIRRAKTLMQKQLAWCREHVSVISNRARKVYDLVVKTPEKNKNLTKRSSNFTALELELKKFLTCHRGRF